jgi:hypothetical protein
MRLMSGAPAILPIQPSGSPSGKHLPGERSTGEAHRRGRVAVVLGLRDGALVVEAEVAAGTMAEVPDPQAAEAMEEEVVGAGVTTVVVAVADHARALRVGS